MKININLSSKIKKNYLLLISGLISLLFVPIWIFLISPQLTQLPKDFSFSANIISIDNFFDEEKGDYLGDSYSKTNFTYETVENVGKIANIKNTFSVRTINDEPIFSVERTYGINRSTLEHVSGYGDKDRNGYLFAPKDLKKGEPFTYWHINYDGPANMNFVDEEVLYGLTVYKYETNYEGVHIDQTENLKYLPGVGVTKGVELEPHLELWIEPETGRMVKYQDNTVAYYYDLETKERLNPWNKFSNTFNEESVEKIVQKINWEESFNNVTNIYIPILFLVISFYTICRFFNYACLFRKFITKEVLVKILGVVILIGCLTSLLGWVLNNSWLMNPFNNTSALNPLTSICIVILTITTLISKKFSSRKTVVIICILILTIAWLKIANLLGYLPSELDSVLFHEKIVSTNLHGSMTLFTTICLTLLCTGLILKNFPFMRRLHISEIHSSLVVVFSILILIGYLFDPLRLVLIPGVFNVQVNTAILFLLLGIMTYLEFGENDEFTLNFSGWSIISTVLLFFIIITALLTGLTDRYITDISKTAFYNETQKITDDIQDRVSIYIQALENGRGLLAASNEVNLDEWKTFVDEINIQKNYPGVQGIGYSVFVNPQDLEDHVKNIRKLGVENYNIHPEGERDIYTGIIFLEPLDERNQQAIGFDMFQEPSRRLAMELARDTGEPRMSSRIRLVQEIDEFVQPGFLIYIPYFGKSSDHNTKEERRKNIIGYVYSPFRSYDFFNGIFGKDGLNDIELRIYDGPAQSINHEIFNSESKAFDDSIIPTFQKTWNIYLAGRPWTLHFSTHSYYSINSITRFLPLIVLGTGLFISLLTAIIFYTLVLLKQRATSYAEKVNLDLKESQKILVKTNQEMADKVSELERMNKVMINRELTMINLKEKIKKLSNDNQTES